MRLFDLETRRHENARWWRNLNRWMNPLGLVIITIVVCYPVHFILGIHGSSFRRSPWLLWAPQWASRPVHLASIASACPQLAMLFYPRPPRLLLVLPLPPPFHALSPAMPAPVLDWIDLCFHRSESIPPFIPPFFFCMLPAPYPYPCALDIAAFLFPCGCLVCLPSSKHSTRLDDVMLLMFFSFVPYIPPGVLDSVSARPWTIIWRTNNGVVQSGSVRRRI